MKQVYLCKEFVIEYHTQDDMQEEIVKHMGSIENVDTYIQKHIHNYDRILVYDNHNDLLLGYVKGVRTNFPVNFGPPAKRANKYDNPWNWDRDR